MITIQQQNIRSSKAPLLIADYLIAPSDENTGKKSMIIVLMIIHVADRLPQQVGNFLHTSASSFFSIPYALENDDPSTSLKVTDSTGY